MPSAWRQYRLRCCSRRDVRQGLAGTTAGKPLAGLWSIVIASQPGRSGIPDLRAQTTRGVLVDRLAALENSPWTTAPCPPDPGITAKRSEDRLSGKGSLAGSWPRFAAVRC